MRVKIKVFALITIMNVCGLSAQDKSVSNIQFPNSPGMSILGIQTKEISRPKDYSTLYSSLISPLVSNNGTLPTDLAMEFSPYFFVSRDDIVNDLLKTNLYRDLKVSVASTKVEGINAPNFSRLGIGVKTNILNGNFPESYTDDRITPAVPNVVGRMIDDFIGHKFGKLTTDNVSSYTKIIQDYIDDETVGSTLHKHLKHAKKKIEGILNSNITNMAEALNALLKYKNHLDSLTKGNDARWDMSLRTGGFLELAAAMALDFPTNELGFSQVNRWGIWLNYTYRFDNEKRNFDLGVILRVSNYSFDPTVVLENEVVFGGLGVSCIYKIPKTKWSVSGEFIGKYGFSELEAVGEGNNAFTFKSVTENKWNLTAGYEVNDNITWTITLSDINGNSDYLRDNAMQILVGINAALVPIK